MLYTESPLFSSGTTHSLSFFFSMSRIAALRVTVHSFASVNSRWVARRGAGLDGAHPPSQRPLPVSPAHPHCVQERSFQSTSQPLWLPIKDVEVLSLVGDGAVQQNRSDPTIGSGRSTGTARLVQIVAPPGSLVTAGDVVAVLQTEPNGSTTSVRSPQDGKIVAWTKTLTERVQLGDVLFRIDTDVGDDVPHNDVHELVAHVATHNGTLPDDVFQTYLEWTDVPRIQIVANVLRDRFPTLRERALALYSRVLALQRSQPETPARQVATTATDIGILLYRMGDLEQALTHLSYARDIRIETLGPEHPETAAAHIHIGAVLNQKGDLDGAFDEFQTALQAQIANLGESHALVAASWNNLGAIRYQTGQYAEALSLYRKALAIHRELHGEAHADTAGSYHNVSIALKHVGDNMPMALEHCQKALQIRRDVLGPEAPDTAASHYALGQLLSEIGQWDAAVEQYKAAVAIHESVHGRQSPITASGYNNLGAVYYQQQNYAAALTEYRKGLDILQAVLPSNHADVAAAWNNVGLALAQQASREQNVAKLDEALAAHRHARAILEESYGPDHPSLAMTVGSIGNVLKAQQQFDAALSEFRHAHVLLEKALGPVHADVASSHNNIGLVLAQQARLEEALAEYRAAQKAFAASLGDTHPHTGSTHFNMGLVLQELQRTSEAKIEYDMARAAWTVSLGRDHDHTQMAAQAVDILNENGS